MSVLALFVQKLELASLATCARTRRVTHSTSHTHNITHSTSHTQHHTYNNTHSTSHIQHHTFNITYATSHTQHHIPNITHSTSHTPYHTPNITHLALSWVYLVFVLHDKDLRKLYTWGYLVLLFFCVKGGDFVRSFLGENGRLGKSIGRSEETGPFLSFRWYFH